MRSAKQLLVVLTVLALYAATVACSRSVETASAAGPAVPAAALGSAPAPAPAQPREFLATAPIIVENQVDLLSQRDGVVMQIFADIGARVRKGQLLARLDSSQLEADRAALEHRLRADADNVKFHQTEQGANLADLQRAEKMFAAGLITKEQLEHTRFLRDATVWQIEHDTEERRQDEAKIRSLDLEIAKTRIVAPFDGVVGRRYIRVGQKVAPNGRLFWVTAEQPLLLRFTLPQEFLPVIKPGRVFPLTTPLLAGERHEVRVVSVSPVVDPASGTIEVVARVLGPAGELRPGMSANVRIPRP
jgi:membrane fusion protein (multidrug efflux system)